LKTLADLIQDQELQELEVRADVQLWELGKTLARIREMKGQLVAEFATGGQSTKPEEMEAGSNLRRRSR
jgi:hypothetical protein